MREHVKWKNYSTSTKCRLVKTTTPVLITYLEKQCALVVEPKALLPRFARCFDRNLWSVNTARASNEHIRDAHRLTGRYATINNELADDGTDLPRPGMSIQPLVRTSTAPITTSSVCVTTSPTPALSAITASSKSAPTASNQHRKPFNSLANPTSYQRLRISDRTGDDVGAISPLHLTGIIAADEEIALCVV